MHVHWKKGFTAQALAHSITKLLMLCVLWTGANAQASLSLFRTDCGSCHANGAAVGTEVPNGPNFNAAGSSAILTQANTNGMAAATTNFAAIATYIESVRPILSMNVPYRATGATGVASTATVGDIYVNSTHAGISGIAIVNNGGKGAASFSVPAFPAKGNPTANYTPTAGQCGADTFTYRGTPTGAAGNTTFTTTRTANVTIANPVLSPASFATSVAYNTGGVTIDLASQFSGDKPTTVTITGQPNVGTATGSGSGANTITYAASAVAYASSVTIQYQTSACGVTSATRSITLTVGAPPAPTFTTPAASPANAPAGQTGVAYNYALVASSSNTAATFSLQSGSLPAGLSLASNGVISGTPQTVQSTSATIVAQNLNTTGTTMVLNFNIGLGPPVFTSASTANGAVGAIYTSGSPLYTITATNSPTSFSASGLPAGLSLNASTGAITGTPSAAGNSSFTLTASNGVAPNATQSVQFNISNVAPVITSSGPAPGQTGLPFAFQITATNAPNATGYAASNLPPGLTVSSDGLVSGIPTTIGNYTPTLSATNATGTGTLQISMPITLGPPLITSPPVAAGAVGIAFAPYQITALNTPSSFSATGLPPGLTVNSAGLITGTPSSSGTFNATVGASNGVNPDASQPVVFSISVGVPAITSASSASLPTGQAFSYQITGTNGPSSFAATGLPTGLSMSAGGLITGTTYQIGVFSVALDATNGTGTGSATLTLTTTLGPPVFTSTTTAAMVVTQAFSYQITALNTPTSFGASGLPAGLSVDASSGLVSGIPVATGSVSATLSATNASGTAQQTVTFSSVNPAAPSVAARTQAVPFNTATAIDVASSVSGQYTSIAVSTGPSHGSTQVTGTVITYTPDPAWFGADSFSYTATGLGGTSAPAAISITVGTQAPTAAAGTLTVALNTAGTLNLAPLIQGSGISGARITTAPAHGTATLSGTQVTYTPARDYFGSDSFAFVGIGNAGTSAPATVSVTITGRPDPVQNTTVNGMVSNQTQTAIRFSQTQVANFGRHMEGLRRPGGGSGLRRNLGGLTAAGAQVLGTPGAAAAWNAPAAPYPSAGSFGTQALNSALTAPATAATLPGMGGTNMATQLPTGTGATASLPIETGVLMALNQMGVEQAPLLSLVYRLNQSRSLDLGALQAAFGSGTPSGETLPGTSVWVEGVVSFGTRDAQGAVSAAEFSSSGVSVGMDVPVSDAFTWGLGLGLARDVASIGTDGSRNQSQGYSLAAYGSYLLGENAFVEGMLGVGTLDFDMQRWVAPVADFARSKRQGTQLFGSLGGGLEYRNNGRMVSPYLRLDFSQDTLQAVTETGAGSYALHFYEQTNTTTQGVLGLRGEAIHSTTFGWAVPRARLEWRQDLTGGSASDISYADQMGGARYSIAPVDSRRSALVMGLGSEFLFRDGWALGLDYQLTRASSTESSYALRVRLSKELGATGLRKLLTDEEVVDEDNEITVDSSITWDDNITRAKLGSDIRADMVYTANASRTWEHPLSDHTRLLVTGVATGERLQNFNGLSRYALGVEAAWQYRPSAAFDSPTWGLVGKLTGEDFLSTQRDGGRSAIGLTVMQPLTDRITLFGALTANQRYAQNEVFNTQDTSLRLNLDYALGQSGTAYLSGEYRWGDIVSTGARSLENITVSNARVQDDAYPNGQFFSYRLKASTTLLTVGYNLGLGARDSLDVSWRWIQSTPDFRPAWATSPASYNNNQISASYLMRF